MTMSSNSNSKEKDGSRPNSNSNIVKKVGGKAQFFRASFRKDAKEYRRQAWRRIEGIRELKKDVINLVLHKQDDI